MISQTAQITPQSEGSDITEEEATIILAELSLFRYEFRKGMRELREDIRGCMKQVSI